MFWTTEGLLKKINVLFGSQLVLDTPDLKILDLPLAYALKFYY